MIEVSYPGGLAVNAAVNGFTIRTDQPEAAGGGGTAPSPFDLFLVSIAACAGYYALRFCRERGLSTLGLRVSLGAERDDAHKKIARIRIAIDLPEGFPERYRAAMLRSVSQCSVKRHLEEPPAFEFSARAAAVATSAERELALSAV
ncbi:MAG TPA: OsmC family protein [Thermoanaerobaculia bacterium]|nr:OsmC family protein [Thermoanaerobaculia bacterium]